MAESGWVIKAAGPKYWTGRNLSSEAFSSDHNKAVRFCREEDASAVLYYGFKESISPLLVVREHVWLDADGDNA